MATTEKPPVLVVLQLSGGNDYMNTVVPYKDPLYWDYRPRVALPEDQILLLDNDVGLHPSMGPMLGCRPTSLSRRSIWSSASATRGR
jgi:uncharacterized protein (DUF1501 family)